MLPEFLWLNLWPELVAVTSIGAGFVAACLMPAGKEGMWETPGRIGVLIASITVYLGPCDWERAQAHGL